MQTKPTQPFSAKLNKNIPQPLPQLSPSAQQQFNVQTVQQVRTIFDPDVMRGIGELVDDAPERIMRIMEQNNDAERQVRLAPIQENRRRDWMVFLLLMGGILLTGFLSAKGNVWLASGAFLSTLAAGLASYFIRKR